jgi:hypothetical protein
MKTNMKNKTFLIGFLLMLLLAASSCAGSRTGYSGSHRKGYGCPANAS